jgi:membrane-bound lytic murein transglycosylase D
VQQWIAYFTEKPQGRKIFAKWLSRSRRYAPLILKTMREDGLPEDLLYLAMIESGFSPKARSRAGAEGVWQFMPYTGKNYGLKIDHWVDERRDIVASTHAAARYLKELHQIFGSWYLAAASYNAGEGRTLRVVRESRTRNFWQLIREKGNFRAETRNYIPKMIAAAMISKNPEKYGFTDIAYEEPLTWEKVSVPAGVDLRSIAKLADIDYEYLKLLNPELRRAITPPNLDSWDVRVPPAQKDILLARRSELKGRKHGHFITHTIRRGETLGHVSKLYGVDQRSIMELNQIRDSRRLRIGQTLQIPADYSEARPRSRRSSERAAYESVANSNISSSPTSSALSPSAKSFNQAPTSLASNDEGFDVYEVRSGDNLEQIARRFGTNVSTLRRINGIRGSRINAGQKIKVPSRVKPAGSAGASIKIHRVRSGEHLKLIADRYGSSVAQIKKLNKLKKNTLVAGQELKVPDARFKSSRVKHSDTL